MSIKLEKTSVYGWEAAIRGARNPMNSWDKSDTSWGCNNGNCGQCGFQSDWCGSTPVMLIGPNDHKLLMNLAKGGTEEAKWRRMIHVGVDITAPLYWWKEFDTYKVGTVANSCSTMHKIHAKKFELEDFSSERLIDLPITHYSNSVETLLDVIKTLNYYREQFIKEENAVRRKEYWWQIIQLLPSSYNQKRTIDLNYEVLASQYRQRKNHKLDEWHQYCDWIKMLPYSEFLTMEES